MPSFKTADGREWLIRLDAPKIREVRTELEIDLGALDFSKVAQSLANDPVLLVDVLWVLCREQAQNTYKIESRAFGESLVGDALDDAAEAIIKARADFSPARMKALILKTAETSERIRAKAAEMATARLSDPALEDRILKATEAKLMAEMEAALTRLESVASSPESAASTPVA